MDLLLASQSERRRVLLRHIVDDFRVEGSDIDETTPEALPPPLVVQHIARRKALAASAGHPGTWVLAADTMVVHGVHLVGKAKDEAEARALLADFSGGAHEVMTGLALAWAGEVVDDGVETTRVLMGRLPRGVVDAYAASGAWRGKAGAYGVQDDLLRPHLRLEGAWSNVVGLPMERTWRLLHRNGIPAKEPPSEEWLQRHIRFRDPAQPL